MNSWLTSAERRTLTLGEWRIAPVQSGQDRRTGHSPAQLYNATTVGGSCRQRSVGGHAVGNACDACDCSGGGSAYRTFDIQDL
jgi:hypothetical protein